MILGILMPVVILIALALVVVGCFAKNQMFKKICRTALSLLALLIWLLAMLILPNFLVLSGVWLPYVICGGLFLALILLIWKPFAAKVRRVATLFIIAAVVMTTVGAIAAQMYHGRILESRDGDTELPLYQYEPFREDTLAKSLAEASTLSFTAYMPRLDGATALYPLYAAFARATYPENDYSVYSNVLNADDFSSGDKVKGHLVSNAVICSKTGGAIKNLLEGYADLIFIAGIPKEAQECADSLGLTLHATPIGKEAFVFFVNKRNAAENLSTQDLIDIYSGKITNWREVGGGNASIKAYQRPDGSGSQTALKELMGEASLMPAPENDVYDTMMGMYRVVANYKNYKNSLGYSFRYYLTEMLGGGEIKLLSIDGVAPNESTIASGAYPLASTFHAVTAQRKEPSEAQARRAANAQKLIEWILSEQGQELVKSTGYVPLSNN